jgi:group II intron reverse transcriptase/maturase
MPDRTLTSLSHHIDLDWLREAYRLTRKDGAVGVDGQTAEQYAENLEENLAELLDLAKSGRYRAPAVRRVHIPKGRGKTRPIAVPTFGDKVLQRAVVMLLTPVYEEDFLDCSYGFRPGRSAHDALQALWDGMMLMGGGWVLDLDIERFFDTIDRVLLQQVLRQRVNDGVVKRLVGKWLRAEVMESGKLSYPDAGTPQGGVISPLLANIFLHEVLDTWFHEQVIPRLSGRAFLVRYADDAVLCFEREEDARRVMEVLPKRFEKYGLTVHPEKTRLVECRRPRGRGPKGQAPRPSCFDFLGFTHHWAKSLKGNWVLKRRTSRGRHSRALATMNQWCRWARHLPVGKQQSLLSQKLRGHYAYYGITGNSRALGRFYTKVVWIWRKWLDRRSNNSRMPWDRFKLLLERHPLPPPIAVHSTYRLSAMS